MPDLIRHPVQFWIPAFAGMTALTYIVAGVIRATINSYCTSGSNAAHASAFAKGIRNV
jgi:hypothetical protein